MHDERYSTTRSLVPIAPWEVHGLAGGLRTRGFGKSSTPDLPLISVATVVFNGSAHLRQTIESVLSQPYPNVEYVIVDGGSTDGTLDIIRSFEHAIDYWISEPDGGIYDAMNKGIRLATGSYVGLLNADDWYQHNTIPLVADAVQKNPADIVFGKKVLIDDDGLAKIIAVPVPSRGDINNAIHRVHPTVFAKRSIYDRFTFDTKYRISADLNFFFETINAGCTAHAIDAVITYVRAGGASRGFHLEDARIRRRHFGRLQGWRYALHKQIRRRKSKLSRKLRSPEERRRRKLASGWVPVSDYLSDHGDSGDV